MQLSLGQRFSRGLSAVRTATPGSVFIGPTDARYTAFHGIDVPEHIAHSAIGRLQIAKRAVWVYACVTARADSIKSVPLKLYKTVNGRREEVVDHPIVDLLRDINPIKDTPASIRQATEQGIAIHGRYQWKKVRNNAGIVKELYGLPTQFTKVIPNLTWIEKFEFEKFVSNKVGRVKEEYPPEDVIYFRCPDFDDGVDGLGPLEVCIETTQADISIVVTQNAMARNAARPSAIMTVLNKMNDSDFARENERVQQQYAGAMNAGKILLIDNAQDTKFQVAQLTPAAMKWIEEHASHVKDICAAFRVPPGIAGSFDEASRIANAGAMHRFFAEIFVRPELQMFEHCLNWQLLWTEDWGRGIGWEQDQGLFLEHDVTGISMFREDETARSNRAQIAQLTGASMDEVLEMHGLEPIGPESGGDVRFVQSNLVPLSSFVGGAIPAPTGVSQDTETENEAKHKQVDKRPRKPPNVAETPEPDTATVKAAKMLEKRQFRSWKRHNPEGVGFKFNYLNAQEQRSLISPELEDEIRDTLDSVKEALERD